MLAEEEKSVLFERSLKIVITRSSFVKRENFISNLMS